MKWELSDGTVVHLGGKVEGDSSVAAKLRASADRAERGVPDSVTVRPPPGGWEPLDVDDPLLMDVWVRTAAAKGDVAVTSAPELEPLQDERGQDADGAGRIY